MWGIEVMDQKPAAASVWERARVGARDGIYAAIGLTLFALVVAAIGFAVDPKGFDELPIPLGGFIALYFVGGVVCGAVYGVLRPVLNSSLGGSILAGVVLCTLGLGIMVVAITIDEARTAPPKDLTATLGAIALVVLGVGALVGVMLGLIMWARRRGGWLAIMLPSALIFAAALVKSGVLSMPNAWSVVVSRALPILVALGLLYIAKRWFPSQPNPPV